MAKRTNMFKKSILLCGDIFIIIFSINLSMFVRFLHFTDVLKHYTVATFFTIATYIVSFYVFDMYNIRVKFKGTYFFARFFVAIMFAAAFTTVFFYAFPSWKMGRGLSILNMFIISVFSYYWRVIFQNVVVASWKPRRLVIVGAGRAAEAVCKTISESKDFEIIGFLDDAPDKTGKRIGPYGIISGSSVLRDLAERDEIDAVLVAITHEKRPELLKALLDIKVKGLDIFDVPTFYEQTRGLLPVAYMRDGWIVYAPFHGMKNSIYAVHVKRLMDMALSFLGLVVCLPLGVAVAIMIKMDSKGPVFFRQKRVGLNGNVFEIVKFRSMVEEAESEGEAVWAGQNDPRATGVGKIIRRARIDELPQMWNVLTGAMSFIGPRPERPEFVTELQKDIPFYALRHAVKPGITGWAQVNYRYGASKEDAAEKLQYDLFYLKNLSFFLDLQVMLKTLRVILFAEGSR